MPTLIRGPLPRGEASPPRPRLLDRLRRFRRKQPRVFAVCCAAVAATALFPAWLLFRPTGSDDIVRATVYALRRRDVATLLALTLPQERRRLNLTRSSVQRFLDETMWVRSDLPAMRIEQLEGGTPDETVYRVTSAVKDPVLHFPLRVMATQSPDGRWHLALGKLLLGAAFVKAGYEDTRYSRRVWADLCRKTGVVGYRENHSGYWSANPDGSASPMDPVE